MKRLADAGIETRPGFYTIEQMDLYESPLLENSDFLSKNIICLPFFTDLDERSIQYITQEIVKLKR
jgi:dTDP-4-amino-4,6-dideoxygalactose transaminase